VDYSYSLQRFGEKAGQKVHAVPKLEVPTRAQRGSSCPTTHAMIPVLRLLAPTPISFFVPFESVGSAPLGFELLLARNKGRDHLRPRSLSRQDGA
jgi:hypothetical protein